MEKSQEEIVFENLHIKHLGGWWSSYAPKSIGNIIHWIYVYGTMNLAEQITIGDCEIHYSGELLLRFLFEDDSNIPYFYDLKKENYDFILDNQKKYLSGLKKFTTFVAQMEELYGKK